MPPIRRARRLRKLRRPVPRSLMIMRARRLRSKVLGRTVHSFVEKAQIASIACAGGATVTGTLTYKLNDLNNFASYQNLFDLYKLKAVKVTLVPLANVSNPSDPNTSGQGGVLPMLYVAPNRDQYVPAPADIADVLNDDGAKIIRFTRPTSFYLRSPKPSITDEEGQKVPIQLNVGKDFWLTTGGNLQTISQIAVPHFGHRYVLTNNSAQEMVVQVYVKYYFICKEQD